jgi:hypothetical protein
MVLERSNGAALSRVGDLVTWVAGQVMRDTRSPTGLEARIFGDKCEGRGAHSY